MIIEIRNDIYISLKKQNRNIPKAKDFGLISEKIEFISEDGLILKAELIRTDSTKQKGTVILVHGIRAYKEHYFPICKLLQENGYNSVIVDLRAHGESEGRFCTFGFKEKKDLSILIDSLYNIKNLSSRFGIWGQSLGAAVALQTLEIDERIEFGIIESSFSDFRTITKDYAKNMLGFSIPFAMDYLIWRAESIGDFKAESIRPSESCKNIKQSVLMVHGKLDKRIKIDYGLENLNNLASQKKEFITIENANHLNVWQKGGQDYFDKVLKFINQVN